MSPLDEQENVPDQAEHDGEEDFEEVEEGESTFDTEEQLIEAIQKRVKGVRPQWVKETLNFDPDRWVPPYDSVHVDELEWWWNRLHHGTSSGNSIWPRQAAGRRGKAPRVYRGTRIQNQNALALAAARHAKACLGLKSAVRVNELEEVLGRKGFWKASERGHETPTHALGRPMVFSYPTHVWVDGTDGVCICSVSHMCAPCVTAEDVRMATNLAELTSIVTDILGWHRGIAVGFLLCDVPALASTLTVAIDGGLIIIGASFPEVPQQDLARVYSAARYVIRYERTKRLPASFHLKFRRPRREFDALIKFVEANRTLSWEERRRKWNAKYRGKWEYSNGDSMRVSYSRAMAKSQ